MNFRNLSDHILISSTDARVKYEREILTEILHRFREVDRRRLFSELGYKSLYHMAIKRWHYTEYEAHSRISAMKLSKELPEIEAQINSGAISLSHLIVAQSVFNTEKKSAQRTFSSSEKLEVLNKISNTSVREAEKIASTFLSQPIALPRDQIKVLTEDKIEFRFAADACVQEKIDRLRGLLAHKHPDLSIGELLDQLCDLGLQEWNPSVIRKEKTANKRNSFAGAGTPNKLRVKNSDALKPPITSYSAVMRRVWAKAKEKCEICGSTYALEVDHIHPRANGGSSEIENLRLLCKSCNQRAAINAFGLHKIDPFLSS